MSLLKRRKQRHYKKRPRPEKIDKKTPRIELMLKSLEVYRKEVGSWGNVVRDLGVNRRTFFRWRKTGRISDSYMRLLEQELSKKCPEVLQVTSNSTLEYLSQLPKSQLIANQQT